MLPEKQLKKKIIFLGLENILTAGEVCKKVDRKAVEEILNNLQELEKEGLIKLILITGLQKEKALEKISKSDLGRFFKKENIYCVTREHINSKAEIDRKRHLFQLDKDPWFNDRFFKQHVIKKFIEKGLPKEEMLLIGHDIWTDAFYTARFSGIDFALVKEALSERGNKSKKIIKGLLYIKRDWKDLRKLLFGKFKRPDCRLLESYIYSELKQQLFGDLEGKIIQAKIRKKQS